MCTCILTATKLQMHSKRICNNLSTILNGLLRHSPESAPVYIMCLQTFTNSHNYSIGAAVVVETQAVPSLFSRSYYNRLCFLQFNRQVEDTILPEEWENVSTL